MARKSVEKNIAYDDVKKLYYVNLNFGKDENGKRIKTTKTFKNKTDARKELRIFEANKATNQLVKPTQTTLGSWLDYWLGNIVKINCQETTFYGYNRIVQNHIKPRLGNVPLQELTPQMIQNYYTSLMRNNEKTLAPNTIVKHHAIFKTTLDIAVKQDILFRNPVDRVVAPKKNKSEISFYNTEQVKRLLKLVEGDRLEIIVKLAIYLGLRREEIMGLRWEDIDFEKRLLYITSVRTMAGSKVIVKKPKNDTSERSLYISDSLNEILIKEYNKQTENKKAFGNSYCDSGYVVVKEDGTTYRPNYISGLFRKFIIDNKLPGITLHGLRHTFASLANSSDISMKEISKALGHSTISTTDLIYTHIFDETHKNTFEQVDRLLSNI